jgi:hypothetical protein
MFAEQINMFTEIILQKGGIMLSLQQNSNTMHNESKEDPTTDDGHDGMQSGCEGSALLVPDV